MKLVSMTAVAAILLGSGAALAADDVFEISIKEHKFNPAEVTVPAGKKLKLVVKNEDATPEEFESHDLSREKIINGNSTATILVGPLEAGTYKFFGEFHEKTAQGKLIVK